MKKKLSVMALAGLLALPTTQSVEAAADIQELEKKIQELSKQLNELKAVIAEQKEVNEAQEEVLDELDDKSEGWDLASRFEFSGDFRSRVDLYSADTVFGRSLDNDTLLTNRLRLNMRVKATENLEFKGRLAMFKTWGNQSGFSDASGSVWPVFDGNVSRTPGSSALFVDRAFVNWTNIGGNPIWFSIGRRPTTDGPPGEIKLGLDKRQATPMAFMDWPFDGLTLGYAWDWGSDILGTSKLRFCYGRGFEAGLQDENFGPIEDMDFAGLSWDVIKTEDRFFYIQSFMAFDLINYPNFQDPIIDASFGAMSGLGPRDNLGNVWHTSAVYQSKIGDLNYFVAAGHSQTMPDSGKMLVGTPNDKDGYSVYTGIRYDLDEIGLKLGAEYNWGSKFWLAMSPGHDDIYSSKLATRGHVFELYTIYNLPVGEKLSKYANAYIRLGYQHYEYDFAGSGNWNMPAFDLGSSVDLAMLGGMGLDAVESADQFYLTFEALF